MSGAPVTYEHIRGQGKAGRMEARLMAIVAEGDRERVYLGPTKEHEVAASKAWPRWKPDMTLPNNPRNFNTPLYGMNTFGDLFTDRQLVALTMFSDLVGEAQEGIRAAAAATGMADDRVPLRDGGVGATAYAEAVGVYLAFAVDRMADFSNTCTRWVPSNEKGMNLFGKQAIAMTWDYPEVAVLNQVVGGFVPAAEFIAKCIGKLPEFGSGHAAMQNAADSELAMQRIVATDPPYYDNIGYADLSDFFYVWLRRSLSSVFPDLFATLAVPKAEELIASPYRHGSKKKAEEFFLKGMTLAMERLADRAHPTFPVTIYYAFKQLEVQGQGAASTGWETFLNATIEAGFGITGTWPLRSEQQYRMVGMNTNALASSIVLVCRSRPADAPTATRAEFLQELAIAMRKALPVIALGGIAPVDLAQASIGPGMAVYSKYQQVLRQDGKPVSVREALQDINNAISAYRTERTSSFDPRTRCCIDFYDQFGFAEAEFDNATVLARAQGIGVDTLQSEHLLIAERGKAWLVGLKSSPSGVAGLERRFGGSVWKACLRLAVTLEEGGGVGDRLSGA